MKESVKKSVKKSFQVGGFVGLGLSVTALIIGGISGADIVKDASTMTEIGGMVLALIALIIAQIGGKKA